MPGLRARNTIKKPEKFEAWIEGEDGHAPTAIWVKKSRKKSKAKQYRDTNKTKKEVILKKDNEVVQGQEEAGSKPSKQEKKKKSKKPPKKLFKVKMKFPTKKTTWLKMFSFSSYIFLKC